MTEPNEENWKKDHRRFFGIGGITIQVDSDLPYTQTTFSPKLAAFRTDGPGLDTVRIHHHFSLPDLREKKNGGIEVYRRPPWTIHRSGSSWIYTGFVEDDAESSIFEEAVFSDDHGSGEMYNNGDEEFRKGDLHGLTMFPTDQILIARLLADRNGVLLHSSGAVMDGKGLLFVGHSEAGKTTISRLIAPHATILCDDRNIVRRHEDGWRVYGTWSHGDLPTISPESAPLHAVLFLEKAGRNRVVQLEDRLEVVRRLLACVIHPFVTADWWEKTLSVIEGMAREVPCYVMESDRSGAILGELQHL